MPRKSLMEYKEENEKLMKENEILRKENEELKKNLEGIIHGEIDEFSMAMRSIRHLAKRLGVKIRVKVD